MNKHRQLIPLGALAMLLVIAAIAIIVNHRGSRAVPATAATPTGYGPYLTASAIPQGLGGRVVPRFQLTDARAGSLSSVALRGRPYALTFLYVHCVDVCPLIGSEIHDALAQLGPQAKRMNVVAISVDPRGDTRKAVQQWLLQHQEPANFHYLIGSQRTLAPIWNAFFVSPQIPGDPHSSHTAVIWLIDQRGRLAALIDAGVPIDVTNLAHDFRVLIDTT